MKAPAFLAAIAATISPAYGASLPAPVAQAASGQLQCSAPDTTRKTCSTLAGYRIGADGTIDSTAVVLISKNPIITMETATPVQIRSGEVCGRIRNQDIDAGKFAA